MLNVIGADGQPTETKGWSYDRRNVNKIANAYAAVVERYDETGATLRDDRGRLFWVEPTNKRREKLAGRV